MGIILGDMSCSILYSMIRFFCSRQGTFFLLFRDRGRERRERETSTGRKKLLLVAPCTHQGLNMPELGNLTWWDIGCNLQPAYVL